MRRITALALGLVALAACQSSGGKERARRDQTDTAPASEQAPVVDVAVLQPEVATPDREVLRGQIRSTARRYLIEQKSYAVPTSVWVDRALASHPDATTPGRAARAAGSDAALVISLDQWETGDLIPRGRIYAGGQATLYGPDAWVWRRTFHDWMLLAPGNVTAINRAEVAETMLRNLVRDLLTTLPAKQRR